MKIAAEIYCNSLKIVPKICLTWILGTHVYLNKYSPWDQAITGEASKITSSRHLDNLTHTAPTDRLHTEAGMQTGTQWLDDSPVCLCAPQNHKLANFQCWNISIPKFSTPQNH